jgi:chromosome partitioning protein
MPKYVTVINQKGGAGKTTTTVNLCGALNKLGHKVLAVDCDPQQSLTDWMQMGDPVRFPFAVMSMDHPHIHRMLPAVADSAGFDYVLMDCPPGGQSRGNTAEQVSDMRDRITRSAALLADMILVPLPPKPTDFMAAARLKGLLVDLCSVKPALVIAVVINEKKEGEKMSRVGRETAYDLLYDEAISLTILESEICERAVVAGSSGDGVTILDQVSKSSSERVAIKKASAEYMDLAKEIVECLTTPSQT